MAGQSDKSDSIDPRESYLSSLRVPEHSDPKKVAANKLILNDFGKYPELWDETDKAYGILHSKYLVQMLEARHNLETGELDTKWSTIRKYYVELIKMGKLPFPVNEPPFHGGDIIAYPYMREMQFYFPTVIRLIESEKCKKRRHCDDELTQSERDVHSEPAFHCGEESSSQSGSLETRPGSRMDTDSQDSSQLLSQHDTDSQDSSESRALLESLDRAAQTSSSSRTSRNPSILRSLLTVRGELHRPDRRNMDKDIARIVKTYEVRGPRSSEDSSPAQ